MFTESSNPTIAKKASEVAAVTAMKAFLSSAVSNATTREKSTSAPPVNAHSPTRITTSRPVISMMVKNTLSLTLSPTPRRLTRASAVMKNSASATTPAVPKLKSKPLKKFAANVRAAVDADVIPEHITTKAMRNVTNWMPNALCA